MFVSSLEKLRKAASSACISSSQKSVEPFPSRSLSQQTTQPELSFSQVTVVGCLQTVQSYTVELSPLSKVTTAAQTIPLPSKSDKTTDTLDIIEPVLTCEVGISAIDHIPQNIEDRLAGIESLLKNLTTPTSRPVIDVVASPPQLLEPAEKGHRPTELKRTFDIGGAVIVRGSFLKRRRL